MSPMRIYESSANVEKVTVGYEHRLAHLSGLKRKLKTFGLICEIWIMLWLNIRIDYIWRSGYLKAHGLYWCSWLVVCSTAGIIVWTYPWEQLTIATSIGLFLLSWFGYYGLLSLFFRLRVFEYLWKKYGRAKTIMIFEPMLALMFLGFMLGFGALVETTAGQGPSIHAYVGSTLAVQVVAVILWVIGYIFKTWATWLIGMDIFFFHDQILRTPGSHLVQSKLYTYFTHPTYSVGYLGVYAYALWHDTLYGIAGGLLLHLGIFAFVKLAEEPGMRELYDKPIQEDQAITHPENI